MPAGVYERRKDWVNPRKSPYHLKLRKAYWSMMDRCYLKTDIGYPLYGGRGCIVCDEWKGKVNVFCKWAMENGWSEGLQLDKDIKGTSLLYSPEYCSFVTPIENSRTKRNSRKIEYNGELLTVCQIHEKYGVKKRKLYYQIYNK